VLKDPEKRKAYDQYGADWKTDQQQKDQRQYYQQAQYSQRNNSRAGTSAGFDFGGEFSSEGSDYSDFFEAMFGHGARQKTYQKKGKDVDVSISIPLEDAYTGTNRTITFKTPELSPTGAVEYKKKTLNVMIPKGIKKGGRIRLKGHGAPGNNGGEAGDMYIRIDINKHKLFDVEGSDVYLTLPVAPWEAALGKQVNVPSPAGTFKLNIPKGSISGKKLRVKGKGIPSRQPGNFYVILQIVLPPADNKKAKKIYEDMSKLNFHPRSHLGV
jgi:curved DNA-binding protein